MYSGMRISEMTSLKWKNVDMKHKKIKVVESSAIRKVRDDSSEKNISNMIKLQKQKIVLELYRYQIGQWKC